VYFITSSDADGTSFTETGSTYLYNFAMQGGVIFCQNCNFIKFESGTTITANKANNGGVVYMKYTSTNTDPTIEFNDVSIIGNSANNGGIVSVPSVAAVDIATSITFNGGILTFNMAHENGGFVHF